MLSSFSFPLSFSIPDLKFNYFLIIFFSHAEKNESTFTLLYLLLLLPRLIMMCSYDHRFLRLGIFVVIYVCCLCSARTRDLFFYF